MTRCIICQKKYKPLRRGRCHACNEFYRRRGIERTKENLEKKTCIHGHPYSHANVYVDKEGRRHCRTCHRQREMQYRRENGVSARIFHHMTRTVEHRAYESARQRCTNPNMKCW